MKLILQFLKPHWKLCLITVLFMIIDVIGALIIPTFAAEMMNLGIAGVDFIVLLHTCEKMLVAALISGTAAILGALICADLTSKVGADLRSALYRKTLLLSGSDFHRFGTASVTTRTVSDVTNIQFALLSAFQMLLPVPIIFIISLILTFQKDLVLGFVLTVVLVVITLIMTGIMRSTAPRFRALQKKLDCMSQVLLENITGVRVIRAFNKQAHEEMRMNGHFLTMPPLRFRSISVFSILDGVSFFGHQCFDHLCLLLQWLSHHRRTFSDRRYYCHH